MLANCIYSLPPEFQVPWQESDEKLRLVVLEVARRWHAVDGTTVVATEASTPAEPCSLRLTCNSMRGVPKQPGNPHPHSHLHPHQLS